MFKSFADGGSFIAGVGSAALVGAAVGGPAGLVAGLVVGLVAGGVGAMIGGAIDGAVANGGSGIIPGIENAGKDFYNDPFNYIPWQGPGKGIGKGIEKATEYYLKPLGEALIDKSFEEWVIKPIYEFIENLVEFFVLWRSD